MTVLTEADDQSEVDTQETLGSHEPESEVTYEMLVKQEAQLLAEAEMVMARVKGALAVIRLAKKALLAEMNASAGN